MTLHPDELILGSDNIFSQTSTEMVHMCTRKKKKGERKRLYYTVTPEAAQTALIKLVEDTGYWCCNYVTTDDYHRERNKCYMGALTLWNAQLLDLL